MDLVPCLRYEIGPDRTLNLQIASDGPQMIRSVRISLCAIVPLALSLIGEALATTVYKCVDPAGGVAFSETPCNGGEKVTVDVPCPSAEEQRSIDEELRRSREYNEAVGRRLEKEREARERSRRSESAGALGSLPNNAVSEYLQTMATSFSINTQARTAQYGITIKVKSKLPRGAMLDVCFANPAAPDNPFRLTKRWDGGSETIFLTSPEFRGLRCGNHRITISIYDTADKKQLLGTHNQFVQSRIDLTRVRTTEDLLDAMLHGNCP